ncbi:MAG: metal ABC transporter permease [Bacilli bacterium]|nr:metal ABC transporter permease [Bacilli bacterium]
MQEILDTLLMYLSRPFVQYALIVGVLIALCSSLLGVTLVLKRFSFVGDGLSHVAFGAMCVAQVVGLSKNMFIIMPVTILAAVLLLRVGKNTKVKGDAAIAMVSVAALAFGYLIVNLYASSPNVSGDVCSSLFGSTSILTLKPEEVWLCVGLSLGVVLFFILFYNRIFAITFDENFSKAVGTKTDMHNLFVAIVIAIIIVLAMNLVGSLLISALIVFPALSAMRLFNSFKTVTIVSAIFSVVCTVIGLLASILMGTPVGATIVAIDVILFATCFVIGLFKGGLRIGKAC